MTDGPGDNNFSYSSSLMHILLLIGTFFGIVLSIIILRNWEDNELCNALNKFHFLALHWVMTDLIYAKLIWFYKERCITKIYCKTFLFRTVFWGPTIKYVTYAPGYTVTFYSTFLKFSLMLLSFTFLYVNSSLFQTYFDISRLMDLVV